MSPKHVRTSFPCRILVDVSPPLRSFCPVPPALPRAVLELVDVRLRAGEPVNIILKPF